jgi:hypothetical protein
MVVLRRLGCGRGDSAGGLGGLGYGGGFGFIAMPPTYHGGKTKMHKSPAQPAKAGSTRPR